MIRLLTLLGLSVTLLACEEEVIATASNAPGGETAANQPKAQGPAAAKDAEEEGELPPEVEFQEADFEETDRSRDPFRSFADFFSDEEKGRIRSQRQVLLDQYSLDELKLIGIVSGIRPPRAMLVDPTGKGHVVRRGQFVGAPEIVHGGTTGADYEINWRVERIRDGDIVLVREDPANPDVPSATRVIALRPEERG